MILAPIQTLVAEIPPIDPRSVRSGSVGGIGVQLVPPTRRGLLNRSPMFGTNSPPNKE